MRVTTKSDYALRALVVITTATEEGPLSADEIGRRESIPKGFLQTILADLRRHGILGSVRGKSGGWVLTAPASTVSIADVIRAVDGPLVSIHGQRPEAVEYSQTVDALQEVWIAARHALRDVLEQVTIADLHKHELPAEVARRAAIDDAWEAR